MSRWEEIWPEYEKRLKAKLQAGYEEHTDASFARTPEELIEELLDEAIDISGWGLVLFARIQGLKSNIERLGELKE